MHLGRMVNNRPSGIRAGSDVVVAIDGNQCDREGMNFHISANGVISTEGFEGVIPRTYINQVYHLRSGQILYTQPGGCVDEVGTEEEKKRPASAGSSISTHKRVRGEGEHPSGPNRERVGVDYRVEFPLARKRGVINEDPFDWNVRVKVKVEPEQAMQQVGSVLDRHESNVPLNED